MKEVVFDIETDGLNPENIWCIVVRDVNEPDVYEVFREPTKEKKERERFKRFSNSVDKWIGHNVIAFDLVHLRRLLGITFPWTSVVDTLVISRLVKYKNPNLSFKHSLDAWGGLVGHPKDNFNDFSRYSNELVERCIQDTKLNLKVYNYLKPWVDKESWKDSIWIEHHSAFVCQQMHEDGFAFDIDLATNLLEEISDRLSILQQEIVNEIKMPEVLTHSFEVTQKKNLSKFLLQYLEQHDNGIVLGDPEATAIIPVRHYKLLHSKYPYGTLVHMGDRVEIYETQEFNPGSSKQRIEVLNSFGWNPVEKTKGHNTYLQKPKDERTKELDNYWETYGWKCSEANLETLPNDAPKSAHKLTQWLVLESRRSTLQEWINEYNPKTKRIHGTFLHIGSWTHRKSHKKPNMANVFSSFHGEANTPVKEIKAKYDGVCRSCWKATEGTVLVGTDAEGIQLRILAHLLNNKEYIYAVENGRKEDKTDIHNVNLRALGLPHLVRDHAKTFIYAWVLGASIPKVAEILECGRQDAERAVSTFIERTEGLSEFREQQLERDARQGFFEALDGRKVSCTSLHHMLAGYLQTNESIIMKRACFIWRLKLAKEKVWFRQVNDVHDEWQTEFKPEDAEYGGLVQRQAIEETGIQLNMRVKLAGTSDIGKNWYETH